MPDGAALTWPTKNVGPGRRSTAGQTLSAEADSPAATDTGACLARA